MEDKQKHIEFRQRIDFFWKSIAVYSVLLLMYSLLRGTIENRTLTLKLYDPLVILFAVFILFAVISILYRLYIGRVIIINEDNILLKNRLGERIYSFNQIHEIKISKKRIYKTKSEIRVIKIAFKGRKRLVRIRPASYENPQMLTKELIIIKKRLKP